MLDMLTILSADSEENALENTAFSGFLHGAQAKVGVVLLIVGLLIIYFGIKVLRGYKFLPEHEQNIPKDDNYVPAEAKVLQKKKTEMPDFNGSGTVQFVEWKIGYEVDGEKYTQIIPDDGYEKGQILNIKYDPDAPQEYYLDNGTLTDDAEQDEQQENEKSSDKNFNGYVFEGIGLLVAVVGVMLIL